MREADQTSLLNLRAEERRGVVKEMGEMGGELKTRDWKSRDRKTRHPTAGLENAGLEKARTDWLWKDDQA